MGSAVAAAERKGGEGPPVLELRQLARVFGTKTAVDDLSLSIAEGEFFTIVGPSGSGKSTLIRMMAGLEQPSSGDILCAAGGSTMCPPTGGPPAWCSNRWRCSIT